MAILSDYFSPESTSRLPVRASHIACVVLLLCSTSFAQENATAESGAALNDEQWREKGAAIYAEQCQECHGKQGVGVDDVYPDALIGDLSIGELTEVIDTTMPEGDPEACAAEDAEAVARFVHHAFYSEAAQIRNRPPRIGLARLTANQLRHSLADLYAGSNLPRVENKPGVKGVYFTGTRWKNENKKIDRVDPTLDFDWGEQGPGAEIDPKGFYVYWEGSLRPDITGDYEIVVRSTCSFVMNFGSLRREFINNNVQSGDKTEFRVKLHLTAGRCYPFKIDFRQRNRSTEIPPAKFQLAWVPPEQTEHVIPSRNLIASAAPSAFALQTDLPPDDRSYGYERGIAIDRQWDESTTNAAIEFANIAFEELWPQYSRRHRDDPNDNREVIRGFLVEIAERAFRGPLSAAQKALYVDAQVDAEADDREAVKRSMLLVLKSPRFLYPSADFDRSPSQRAANRLALVLHDSLPTEQWLLTAIKKDALTSEKQIRDAASRMVDDYRTHAKTREMILAWLHLDQSSDIAKDPEKFAGFDDQLISELRTSLIAFLDEIVWSDASDFRQFFQADWVVTSPRLAEFYGVSWELADEGLTLGKSKRDDAHRFGVLSHPYLMSHLAYFDSTSPVHRGVFLIRYLLGRNLRPPTESFTPLSPDLHPDLTTRERVALQTSPDSCQVCHSKINALGFALENFDAVGRYREVDREKPIDASGLYTNRIGEEIQFSDASDLADYLAESDDAMVAFVSRVFQHFVKQPIAAYGPQVRYELVNKFRESGCNIRELIVEVAVIAALHTQPQAQEAS